MILQLQRENERSSPVLSHVIRADAEAFPAALEKDVPDLFFTTGDLEIMNSATKKNTRDVGVTFPTPRPRQPNQQPQEPWHRVEGILGESDGVVTDHQAAGSQGKQKGQPDNFFMEKRTKRSRLHLPQGQFKMHFFCRLAMLCISTASCRIGEEV